ncbi:hypothetical protein SOV_22560 [Sporomusa ovata DSM 2662]|nr:hypothetical protein [Sporomusa ovata]EQB25572.1 hypothetical protein SOV_4c02350 [Sporomusa ovata DSM 2662]
MKSSTDNKQVHNLRWRVDLDTDGLEWSPKQKWLLIVMLIIALAV